MSSHFFSSDYVFTKCYVQLFCNNSFDVNTIKFNRFHNQKKFISCFFQTGLIETWNKKYFSSLFMKKIFYNISGEIHNNISEILLLLEYFRNMYLCHRCLRIARKNTMVEWHFYNFTKLFVKDINKDISYCNSNNW